MNKLIVSGVWSVVVCGLFVMGGTGCKSDDDELGLLGDDDVLIPMGVDGSGGEYELASRSDTLGDANRVTDVSFENVSFAFDSYQIAGSERGKIERVADYLVGNPQVTVVVDGHGDDRGSREYNLSLGEHRALAIRAYLISLGVAGNRVQTRSFGEEQPLDPGHGESAWRMNRRGEFALYQ